MRCYYASNLDLWFLLSDYFNILMNVIDLYFYRASTSQLELTSRNIPRKLILRGSHRRCSTKEVFLNFAKFLRTHVSQNSSRRLFLGSVKNLHIQSKVIPKCVCAYTNGKKENMSNVENTKTSENCIKFKMCLLMFFKIYNKETHFKIISILIPVLFVKHLNVLSYYFLQPHKSLSKASYFRS